MSRRCVEDLSQPVAVPDHDDWFLGDVEPDGLRRRQQPGSPDRVGGKRDQIDGLPLEDETVTLQQNPLAQLGEHALQALRLLQDGHDAGLVVALLVLQQLRPRPEHPQGRGQVVAGHRHEVPVGPLPARASVISRMTESIATRSPSRTTKSQCASTIRLLPSGRCTRAS